MDDYEVIPLISDIYPQRLALDASAGLVVIAVHGYCLALFAKLLGEYGPSYDGRLTADPMSHIDLFSLLGIVLANVGWVKPMDMRASAFRHGNWGAAITILASLLVTYLLGVLVQAQRPLILAFTPPELLQGTLSWFTTFVRISERTALVNLLPLFALSSAPLLRPYLPNINGLSTRWAPALTLALVCAIEIWIW